MIINDSQLKQLYTFTQKHYVEWYDLQMELVDHLANGIEAQWKENPHLSFEDALQKEFKKFGVFGFMEVVEERQKSLSKKYSKLIWKHVLVFFKIPRIFMLLVFSFLVFYLLRILTLSADYFIAVVFILCLGYLVVLTVSNYRNRKRAQERGEKKWLFKDIMMQQGAGFGLALLPIHFFNFILPNTESFASLNAYVLAGISFLFVLMCVMVYVMLVELPKRAEVYLQETYPEYQLVD
ncbi:hypothetical protein [Nonlabens sp.]|uniref:hypothetical protein n=1 Tax=Nonlabens sp. TaxID=1888209 RepID=UPI001BCE10BA|nr:hypothetical protein [Nonlabens sp.]